jgi:type VI secretion system protein ImpK
MAKEVSEETHSTVDENRKDNLALLFQGFLVVVVRVQSKREKIGEAVNFRRKMKAALQETERRATALNYDFQDTQDAKLAVVAFLDEVILASDDPMRGEWMRFTLAQDLLGQPAAGEVFFERLEGVLRSAKEGNRLADVLEVYLLCLVLGFEGKYSGDRKAELHAVIERTRLRIETIRQQRGKRLSPEGRLPEELLPAAGPKPGWHILTLSAAAAGGVVLVLFVIFKLHLYWATDSVLQMLQK